MYACCYVFNAFWTLALLKTLLCAMVQVKQVGTRYIVEELLRSMKRRIRYSYFSYVVKVCHMIQHLGHQRETLLFDDLIDSDMFYIVATRLDENAIYLFETDAPVPIPSWGSSVIP